MAVGALFIRDNFNHESKETALDMIHDIRYAFNDLLEENEWMDVETRLVAEDKANGMNERIGYPEYITNKTRLEEEYKDVSWNFPECCLTISDRFHCPQYDSCHWPREYILVMERILFEGFESFRLFRK